ncbi:tetratricopeptide repeat protein [Bacillus sp. UNC437CL72CviS29]|uniref:tetratricopeptide repeat protein n=1 Tax=Bacillus sp. UNC437CL72CviS29 TaxID=1340430 RepID=UPI0006900493|nr:tetratricopeptide repeat protein [Bacillus sp. UNC437CL72CviS29]
MKKYVQVRDILIGLTNLTQHPEVLYECAYIHDVMGLKTEAVPFYEKAIVNGLKGEALCRAYIGLGSTYRCIGEYDKAIVTLEAGLKKFPDNETMKVVLFIAKYNIKEYEEAMKLLLKTVVKLEDVHEYERAILFYKDQLNKIFK